ncbi:MAG: hemolysin family protein [Candidatus Hydrogenedentota bacterium]
MSQSARNVHEAEAITPLEDDSVPSRSRRRHSARRSGLRLFGVTALWVGVVLLVLGARGGDPATSEVESIAKAAESSPPLYPGNPLPPSIIALSIMLLGGSAFFSAAEVAFFSLHKVRVRAMRESPQLLDRLAAGLLEHPGSLLTTILMSNAIVNVLLSVVLGTRIERALSEGVTENPAISYVLAVLVSTGLLVSFGEIIPKVLVVWRNEAYARLAALPLYLLGSILAPLRNAIIRITGFLFKVTRFSDLVPAPFMTDGELKSVLSESEASGVIETDERRMIEGILEFTGMRVNEILIPRPDVVALPLDATIAEALALLREHEYARIPVYEENLDHMKGVLYTKDLLPAFRDGRLEEPIQPLLRRPLFVPETMTVAEFVKTAQRLHMHLAVVVDEYGGTEGIVALQDALRELVGEFTEELQDREPPYVQVSASEYQVEGNMPLDDLEDLIGIAVEDEEHTTVAGFLLQRSERLLEVGDQIDYDGVRFTVEEVDRHRIERVRIEVLRHGAAEEGEMSP